MDSRTQAALGVGELARLAGITVRTLHHYDEIGLLCPGVRSAAGYRLYGDADVARLQRILFYRELGFGLDRIADLLGGDGAAGTRPDERDVMDHFRLQHRLLIERRERLQRMIENLERTMAAHDDGISLTPQERLEVFGETDPGQHDDEARERWGGTDAYEQSRRRTTTYTKDDWVRIKAEAAAVERAFADALVAGEPADGPVATDAARAHRDHLTRWFYDVTDELHLGLAELYVADERFTRYYEDVAPGLAQYVHDAIRAEVARRG